MGGSPWHDEFEKVGVAIASVPFFGSRFPIPLVSCLELYRLVRQADIVLVMGFWFLLAGAACLAAYLTRSILVLCPAGSLTKFGRETLLKRIYYWVVGRRMLAAATSIVATTDQEKKLLISDFGTLAKSISYLPTASILPLRAMRLASTCQEAGLFFS